MVFSEENVFRLAACTGGWADSWADGRRGSQSSPADHGQAEYTATIHR